MKTTLLSSLIALAAPALMAAPVAVRSLEPIEVPAPIEKIFVPQGFDDNDNVEVVLHGNFPNTCYQVGNTSATIDPETKEVVIKATAYKYPGKLCLQSITPFIQTVSLGLMDEGNYTIRSADNKDVQRTLLVVQRKTESPDDFLYASVENATIAVDEAGKQSLKISGHYPYFFVGCMVLREVKAQSAEDVVVVQPIAEIVDNEECAEQSPDRSFDYTMGLEQPMAGEGLLHVRTLNGTSINRYINLDGR